MKIIQANKYYYLRGGAESYMLNLSNWLTSTGNTVIPFAMKYPENLATPYEKYFPSEVETENVKLNARGLHTLGRMIYSLESRRKLATLIVEQKPNLAHIHNIYTQLSPSILHTLADQHVPTVMTVHDHHLISPQYNVWAEGCGPDNRNIGLVQGTVSKFHKDSFAASFAQLITHKYHRWLNIYARNVDLFLCPSTYMQQQLIRGGFAEHKLRVLPYGIDPNITRANFSHQKYVLFVGRLSEEKGIETIIQLAKILPDITFKIVGRGPEMAKLHRAGDKCQNLEFVGFRMGEELKVLYANATVVLAPSRVHEVFGLSILEAMAHGKPVIASRVGGIPEVVEDGVNGFLVSPLNMSGWTESLMRIFYDDDLQKKLGRNARDLVETRFSLDQHHKKLMLYYEEAVAMKKK
ncbi:MAG: glycosyltransferase family 4 protein [Candidatus Uhrbacteria bacterium]|nr:glycosyltransferase family 4 protein [Candidatus Uhrbacteria bacterium]